METRDRVERLRAMAVAVAFFRMDEIVRAEPRHEALERLGNLADVPAGIGEPREQLPVFAAFGVGAEALAIVFQPAPETRHRRQGGEAAHMRQLALKLLGDLLDQQIAERDAAQALLAVGDR